MSRAGMGAYPKQFTRHAVVMGAIVLGALGCGGAASDGTPNSPSSPVPVTPVLTTLTLNSAAASLFTRQTIQMTATTFDQNAQAIIAPVSWSSASPTIASISSTGLVTAVGAGIASIVATATAGSITLVKAAVITVAEPRVTSVTVTPPTLALVLGGGPGTLNVVVAGDPGVPTTVTWATSNAATAVVSANGVVTSVGAGLVAQVCATSTFDAAKQGCAAVSVTAVPVATVVVTPASTPLFPGQTVQLAAATRDASGNVLTGRAIAWSSSSASIATISPAGLVTAVGTGSATLSATSEGRTGSATVTVSDPVVTSVVVTPVSSSITVGQNVQFTANVSGTGNPPTGVSWASADVTKVTVSATGLAAGVAVTGGTQVCATSSFDPSRSGCGTVIVASATFPSAATISAPAFSFNPAQVDIALGGTVSFIFSAITHNVTFNAAAGVPANIPNTSNTTVSRQFNSVGTFNLQCTLHSGMTASVVVH